jgi:hypothetical protein
MREEVKFHIFRSSILNGWKCSVLGARPLYFTERVSMHIKEGLAGPLNILEKVKPLAVCRETNPCRMLSRIE